jgi:hypothetical protein
LQKAFLGVLGGEGEGSLVSGSGVGSAPESTAELGSGGMSEMIIVQLALGKQGVN